MSRSAQICRAGPPGPLYTQGEAGDYLCLQHRILQDVGTRALLQIIPQQSFNRIGNPRPRRGSSKFIYLHTVSTFLMRLKVTPFVTIKYQHEHKQVFYVLYDRLAGNYVSLIQFRSDFLKSSQNFVT